MKKTLSPPFTFVSALRKQIKTAAMLSLVAWFAGSTNKANAQAYVVSTNTTWTSSSQVPSSATTNGIEIRPGAQLTISGFTLTMAAGKFINVQSAYASFLSTYYSPWNANAAGGKLIVNNAVLTGTGWGGIMVWGVKNASQGGSVPKHGRVEITRSKLEGCSGIVTGDMRVYSGITQALPNANSTGGIVIGVSATFHNAGQILLMPYKWSSGSLLYNDATRFTLCTFITDNVSPTAPNGPSSVYADTRRGIYVVGCTFTDNRSTTPATGAQMVGGRDANVYVLPFCTGLNPQTCNLQYTTSNNVYTGVEVTSFSPFNTDRTVINEVRFNGVQRGVILGGAHSAEVTRNEISVFSGSTGGRRIGIYVTHTNTPKIWDNTLTVTTAGSANLTYGIVVTESGAGSAHTDVYGNKMTDFMYQTQAVGVNRGSGSVADAFGLRYLCNTFANDEENNRDIVVGPWGISTEFPYPIPGVSGVAQKQRNGVVSSASFSAANTFSSKSGLPSGSTNHFLNGSQAVTYHRDVNNSAETPTYRSSNVSVANGSYYSCPARTVPVGPAPTTSNLSNFLTRASAFEATIDNSFQDNGPLSSTGEATWEEYTTMIDSMIGGIVRGRTEFADTNGLDSIPHIDAEALVTVLDALKYGYQYKLALAEHYAQTGDFDAARTAIDVVLEEQAGELDSLLTVSISYLRDMMDAREALAEAGGDWDALDGSLRDLVHEIADADWYIGGAAARLLLEMYEGRELELYTLEVGEEEEGRPGGGGEEAPKVAVVSRDTRAYRLYPNPTADRLNLSVGSGLRGDSYRIADLTGRTLVSGVVKPGVNTLELRDLATGLYVLQILQGSEVVHTAKITKR